MRRRAVTVKRGLMETQIDGDSRRFLGEGKIAATKIRKGEGYSQINADLRRFLGTGETTARSTENAKIEMGAVPIAADTKR